ncbi:hypothetical protein T484DRAFT_1966989, partial [Baffinella frigidus]
MRLLGDRGCQGRASLHRGLQCGFLWALGPWASLRGGWPWRFASADGPCTPRPPAAASTCLGRGVFVCRMCTRGVPISDGPASKRSTTPT